MADGEEASLWHEVGSEEALASRHGRLHVEVEGRHLALIEHAGEVFCMDATCYHMGGPLLHADIEECGDFGPCVVCPWHRYLISLKTGNGLYVNLEGEHCAKGVKQRVHSVRRSGGKLLVQLQTVGERVESDTYAFKKPPPSGFGAGMKPPSRSGDIMKRAGAVASSGGFMARVGNPDGARADVERSMRGADGRAPWSR